MKKLNKMANLIVLAVVANISFTQCMDQDVMTRKVFPKTFIAGCGWTGLSVASFVGKKMYTNWSNIYPENKAHYAKIARRYKITSRIAAIPLVSLSLSALSTTFCVMLLGEKCPESLHDASRALAMPGLAMTFVPAALTTPDLFPTEKTSENK